MLSLVDKPSATKLVVFPTRILIKIVNEKQLFLKNSSDFSSTGQDKLFLSQKVQMTAEFLSKKETASTILRYNFEI